MTLREIVIEIFEALGEPSDLDFWLSRPTTTSEGTIDTSSPGWRRLVRVVNQATLALANWKWPSGRLIRMRFTEDIASFSTSSITSTLSTISENIGIVSPEIPESFIGSLVIGQTSGFRAVLSWVVGTTVQFSRMSGTPSPGETIRVVTREYRFGNSAGSGIIPVKMTKGAPITVVEVRLGDGTPIEETPESDRFMVPEMTETTPTGFYRVKGGFLFDRWPKDGLEFLVRYQRQPCPLSGEDEEEEPEIPIQYHYGIVLWGIWWGLRRNEESNDAYAVRKDLEDFMAKVRSEDEYLEDLVDGQIKIYPKGR